LGEGGSGTQKKGENKWAMSKIREGPKEKGGKIGQKGGVGGKTT